MIKNKTSFSVTEAADIMLARLAENNGLSKSAVLEVLIRQASAIDWSIVTPPAALIPAPAAIKPIPLHDLKIKDARVLNAFRNAGKYDARGYNYVDVNLETLQDVAAHGRFHFGRQRTVGKVAVTLIAELCAAHGLVLAA